MAFDYSKAFETKNGLMIDGAAGVFSGSASPVGSDAPVGSLYFQSDGTVWVKLSLGTSGWQISLPKLGWSQKVTQASGIVSSVEFYENASQVTANRRAKVDLSYTGDLPTSEVWSFYSPDDGTTVLRTVTKTYTWSGSDLQSVTEAVS